MDFKPEASRALSRLTILVLSSAVALSGAVASAAVDIPQTPLQSALSVPPNVLLSIDDSGSMDAEVLVPTNDGALWWYTPATGNGARSFVGRGRNDQAVDAPNYNASGGANATWKKYTYLFPNGTGAGNRVYNDGTNDHYAVPPLPEYAFARSAAYNLQYYNPAVTYRPWVSRGSQVFTDANPEAARSEPTLATSATINLTQDLESSAAGWQFAVWDGMRTSATSNARRSGGRVQTTFSYYPATYFEPVDTDLSITFGAQSFNCASPSPTAYRALEDDPVAVSAVINPLGIHAFGPDGRCLRRVEIRSDNTFSSGRSYEDEIQNFANWFQYSRKRHLALRAGFGSAFETISGLRVGGFTINNRVTPTMWGIDSQRADVYDFFYGIRGNSGGTPNRQGVWHGGNQFDTNPNIVQLACQQNFLLHFTDGFTNPDFNAGVGNADEGAGAPFADAFSNTKADIAMHFYAEGIRRAEPDALELGRVPVPAQCLSPNAPAWLDCNRDPHVNFYGITLGAEGDIIGNTHFNVRDAHLNPPVWQNPSAERSPVQVDDLYHAAVNGRGEMYDARSAEELKEKLGEALRGILSQVIGSQSAVAVNSTRVDTETAVFQARFSSAAWSGELLSFEINPDGSIGAQRWEASALIPPHGSSTPIPPQGSRRIYTANEAGDTIDFQWNALSAVRRAALRDDETLLAFLRGDNSNTLAQGGTFRNRTSRLGDIVHSSPEFLRETNTVFVGANDGMLHAFDASTGVERFAYVPATIDLANLATLADEGYQHKFFVDGEIAVSTRSQTPDRNILVGTLGRGGKSIFALDVTTDEPESLWEFTHPDLGHVTGKPIIVNLPDGTPAVVLGNGYNSQNQRSMLFIINLVTGEMIGGGATPQPLRGGDPLAPSNANGMGSPRGWDSTGNGRVDLIFAGDLQGNVWKFDLTANNPNQWRSAYGTAAAPQPMFTARDDSGQRQPITSGVSVGLNPATFERWVFFGTGKYLEVSDLVDTSVQSWYGIVDDGERIAGDRDDELKRRSIVVTTTIDGRAVRAFSESVPGDMEGMRGWFTDFAPPAEGERIVSVNTLIGNVLISASIIPTDDPCEQGGRGFINAVDAFTGAALATPFFDMNGDGVFDDGDTVPGPGDSNIPIGSIDLGVGMPTLPAILRGVLVGGGSSGQVGAINIADPTDAGRISWREIVRD